VASAAKELPCLLLLAFASEGDNVGDAVRLSDAARVAVPTLLAGESVQWQFPPSWQRSV